MRTRMVVVAALVILLAFPSTAHGETPPLVNWGALLPGFTPGLDTSDSNICTNGSHRCVEGVIRQMTRQFDRDARRCDHNAIFALGYLRTTEAYYESSQIPGFYDDVPFLHHYDAVFARYYLEPRNSWIRGRAGEVPPAWREAFASADAQELTSSGNFLMGMNAHINRDLPLVLRDIGLTDEDGNSRKPDHERVNEFLNHVGDDLTPEMVQRFDPAFDTNPDDDVLVGFTVQQIVQEWRERAWNNAWLMAYSPGPVADLVAQGIEAGSALLAQMIREGVQVEDAERDARNAHCAENWDNWDGGDGTFFDEEGDDWDVEPLSLPQPSRTLDALRLLGVRVDVSILGVSVSLG